MATSTLYNIAVPSAPPASEFAIEDFLAQEQQKDLLRFTTAGSVDDGKSTLIGRLLYDSRNVYEDQMESVAKASFNHTSSHSSAGSIDFSLLTDGLRAEREQGITIDVAYRYFATSRRKFIIADTPGHEQYTCNMATGASTADLALILVDVRNGILPQSRRHAFIASLLGIERFVVAINKMDLVNFEEAVFRSIEAEFRQLLDKLQVKSAWFVPISALFGDNVVERAIRMPWFKGPSLLEYLESVDIPTMSVSAPFRFPVQRVVRPNSNFRGYAGQVVTGSIRPGDPVYVLPAGRCTRIRRIATFDGDLSVAHAPMSITLTLHDEIDISRGDMISAVNSDPYVARHLEATVVWMHPNPLEPHKPYLVKQTTQTIKAEIQSIRDRINIHTFVHESANSLELNEIGTVEIETAQPIFFDSYKDNRYTGGIIIIDPSNNLTVGAGMILGPVTRERARMGRVTPGERLGRYGHTGAILSVGLRATLAELVERMLFDRGFAVAIADSAEAARTLQAAGLIAILQAAPQRSLPDDDQEAATHLISLLERSRN
jgi:sulfate adenylyltransferase large subunit